MPRNGSGSYGLPAGNPVVPSTVISSTWANTTLSDIGTALTQSIANDGQTTPVANLPMATFRHTNVGNAVARNDYAAAGQVQDSSLQWLTSVAGTNTITASITPSPAAYVAGQAFRFVVAGANTGPVTLNINGLGAKDITKRGAGVLVAGDIPANAVIEVVYDGTQFQVVSASVLTVDGTSNIAINSNLDIWTRGTSVSTAALSNAIDYGPDQFVMQAYVGTLGSGTNVMNASQGSFTLGQTDVPFEPTYFARFKPTSVGTAGGVGATINVRIRIESVRKFAGQTFTVGAWLRADSSRTYALLAQQFFGTGGSPSANAPPTSGNTTISVTSSFQYFTSTFTMPSISGKTLGTNGNDYLEIIFVLHKADNTAFGDTLGPIGTFSATPYLDISEVMIVPGGTAPAYVPPDREEDISRAQRFLESGTFGGATNSDALFSSGAVATAFCKYATKKRATTTTIQTTDMVGNSGRFSDLPGGVNNQIVTSGSLTSVHSDNGFFADFGATGSGLNRWRFNYIVSAEL